MTALPPVLAAVLMSAAVLGALVGILAYVTLLERKFAARLQSRIGPYRVGPHGLLQPIADGTNKPYRMKWRGASFSNLAILPHILPGASLADVVAIMGSVDPVFGEVDR